MKRFVIVVSTICFVLIVKIVHATCDTPVIDTSSEVKLSGTVILEKHYGPPNYGQTPAKDEKVTVPILILDAPFATRKNEANGFYGDHSQVMKVQLFSSEKSVKFTGLIKKHVVATGTLMEAINGHHYTDVLEDVSAVEER